MILALDRALAAIAVLDEHEEDGWIYRVRPVLDAGGVQRINVDGIELVRVAIYDDRGAFVDWL